MQGLIKGVLTIGCPSHDLLLRQLLQDPLHYIQGHAMKLREGRLKTKEGSLHGESPSESIGEKPNQKKNRHPEKVLSQSKMIHTSTSKCVQVPC